MTNTTTETTTEAPKRKRSTPAEVVVGHLNDAIKGAEAILAKAGLPEGIKTTLEGVVAINTKTPEFAALEGFRLSSVRQSRPAGPPLEVGDSVRFEDADTAALYGVSTDADFTVESVRSVGGNEEGKGARYWATILTPRGSLPVPASLLSLND